MLSFLKIKRLANLALGLSILVFLPIGAIAGEEDLYAPVPQPTRHLYVLLI